MIRNNSILEDDYWFNNLGNLPYGWAGEVTIVNTMGFGIHSQTYNDIVVWIRKQDNHKNNFLWTKIGDCIYIRIRQRDDLVAFKLKWSCSSRL